MEPTEAEKLKARRTQVLLYWLVGVMVVVPAAIFLMQLFASRR
jgi:phosphoenolpyruvate-protein kinase (PTS system EI component)